MRGDNIGFLSSLSSSLSLCLWATIGPYGPILLAPTGAMLTDGVKSAPGGRLWMRPRPLGAPIADGGAFLGTLNNSNGLLGILVIDFVWPFGNLTSTVLPMRVWLDVPGFPRRHCIFLIINSFVFLPGLENWLPWSMAITLCCIRSCAACLCSSLKSLCCSWTRRNRSASYLCAANVDSSSLVSSITSLMFRRRAMPLGRPVISSPSAPAKNSSCCEIY